MKPSEYEHLVAELVAALVKEVDGLAPASLAHGRGNKISGASGYPHQIDVSFAVQGEVHIIECKCWKKKVTPDAVLVLAARVHDIAGALRSQKVRGALATSRGCGPGATELASYFGIILQNATSPHDFVLTYRDRISAGVTESLTLAEHAVAQLHPPSSHPHPRGSGAA
ncbi:MAG: hypothetical protein DMD38_10780 [Gemmatimonadetes bacterium]|nr:MAG: hypothetical protein AUG85_02225 [Gemmatimonadetes bacterium 13_1_20CM_4_66_11]PYP95777.1 MAG: hypothetical protein DMD38_10780 [Gemmatimonadota bacterium]